MGAVGGAPHRHKSRPWPACGHRDRVLTCGGVSDHDPVAGVFTRGGVHPCPPFSTRSPYPLRILWRRSTEVAQHCQRLHMEAVLLLQEGRPEPRRSRLDHLLGRKLIPNPLFGSTPQEHPSQPPVSAPRRGGPSPRTPPASLVLLINALWLTSSHISPSHQNPLQDDAAFHTHPPNSQDAAACGKEVHRVQAQLAESAADFPLGQERGSPPVRRCPRSPRPSAPLPRAR